MRVTSSFDTLNSVTISNALRVQWSPAVVFNGENYVAVWSDERYIDNYYWVTIARITPDGTVLDSGTSIGAGGNQLEYYPDIAFDGSRCLAVWYNYYAPFGVYGRFIGSDGQPDGSVITIEATTYNYYMNPKIDFDGTHYLVVYVDRPGSYYNVYGQLVAPNGSLVGGQITIAASSQTEYYHDVVWDGYNYVVIWREGSYNIKGRVISPTGQLLGPAFQISATSSYTRNYPTIAASNTNYFIAWSEYRNSLYNIWGNIDQMIGVEEEKPVHVNGRTFPSIITGQLSLPTDGHVKLYDISGREVHPNHMSPGVYFIEIDGVVEQKVVKLR